jgi:hypothetical protein
LSWAAEKPRADFERATLPLLKTRCYRCHGARKHKADLRLDVRALALRGGESGKPAVVPGHSAKSELIRRVTSADDDQVMPPTGKRLSPDEVNLLRAWIDAGAAWPAALAGEDSRKQSHWAFRPLTRPRPPVVHSREWAQNPIDRFVLARLEKQGLSPSPPADRRTLLRRLSFDLTGLPPTPAEIDAFVNDRSADAYGRLVERYLASPQYGERWGKYWLDAAGYADSNGYFAADSDRPLAYHYRDYVLRSFNADKPYGRFVREQLAGDELAGYVPGGEITPTMVELLTATHFLRNAPDGTGESDGNPDEVRTDRFTVLEGNLQNVMTCLLGLTIQCARCHAHKFEPIRHDEYYRLQAIFYPAYCPDRWVKPNDRLVTPASRARREEHDRKAAQIERQVKALHDSLATIAAPLREQLIEERLRPLGPATRDAVLKARDTPPPKRTAGQQSLLKKYAGQLQAGEDDLAKRFPEYAAVRAQVRQAIAARQRERPAPLEMLAVLVETDANPPAHHVLLRGKHNVPGPEVQPGVPAALCTSGNTYRLAPEGRRNADSRRVSTGRRSAFARWVASPRNPLFARVLANRVWQHHFGKGIVATADNLGKSGAAPSHPELLDYLAGEFIRRGWSIKALHRLIVNSAVYRQASAPRPGGLRADPDDRLLWRYPLRRLDAEAVRDAMLAVSGELDRRAFGPYVPTRRTEEGSVVEAQADGARRRSVYLQQRRTQVLTMLELFDAPALVTNCTARNTSTVPLQSLALLNSDFARARARTFARRLEAESGPGADKRVALAFRLAWGRDPTAAERSASRRFVAAQQTLYGKDKDSAGRAWTDFCQMLLAANAFLYVE